MSRVLAAALVLIIGLTAAAPVAAGPPTGEPSAHGAPVATTPIDGSIVEGRVIVGWRDATQASNVARQRGLAVVAGLEAPGNGAPALLSTRGRPLADVLTELRADPAVAYAEPDYHVQLAAVTVNDPMTTDQYSLDQMRVRDAWSLSTGGSGVVAVLDTGVQADHPDLKGRVLAGYDFVNGDANAADDNGHGTWVAGIIAARVNDAYGVAGISWSDKILPVKIMNSGGTGTTYDLARGITWAAGHGATIINMSVGGFPYLQSVQDAVDAAWAKGVVLIGAAGNNNREERFYPASYTNVVSVSATQVNDEFSHWSSYGPSVDVSAPGSSVLTTNCIAAICPHPEWGTHTYISGTSFATPNVAGVVALLRARYPAESPAEVVARLVGSVDDLGTIGWDDRYGHGRVNTYRALGGSVASPVRLAGDSLEGNQTLATARGVAVGSTVSPSIWPAADVDWFFVDAPRMGRLDVTATGVADTRPYPWQKSSLPIDPVIDLYDAAGVFLKRVDAAWESGIELAQLNVGAATRVYVRVSNYYANGNRAPYTLAASFVDETPPRALALTPAPGATMVSPLTDVTFTFSEPVTGVSSASVSLRRLNGQAIPAAVSYTPSTGRVRLDPAAPLPSNTTVRLHLTDAIVDAAGLSLRPTSYAFTTMPGTTFPAATRVRFSAGTHVGHRIGSGGAILGLKPVTVSAGSGANVTQRAALPGLPGRWLYVSNGVYAGTWVRESARASVGGTVEIVPLAPTTRLTFVSGSHTGVRYDALGAVIARKSVRLGRASGANVDQLAIINGQRHYRVTNGIWAGYWMPESARAYRAGFVERMTISRRVMIVAGTHTGVAYSATGVPLGTRVGRLDRISGANASAWAVINGRPHLLIANGMWAGYWLPEHAVYAFER